MHWLRGVSLSLILFVSIFIMLSFDEVQAQEKPVIAKSVGFEETTVIQFQNDRQSDAEIETFRLWLGSDFTFKSFKTEKGWTGTKTPQGVLVFTTTNPIKPGEIVKFGVKTDKPKPGINWKALDVTDAEIAIGKTLVTDGQSAIEPVDTGETTDQTPGVLANSVFRLVPEKPNVGSTMRITGDNFGANKQLSFYIDNQRLESFETDENGHFMFTSKIPENIQADRVNFIIKDADDNQKSISLRLNEGDGARALTEIPFTMSSTPPMFYRGDTVKVTGTGTPGSTVTTTIKDTNGNTITTIALEVDLAGNWAYEGIIPPDAKLGEHTAEIKSGNETIVRKWTIETSQKILIEPTEQRFEPGETITFNGTAIPNEELEIVIENPQGAEMYSEVLSIDSSGQVNIEFPTLQSFLEGTYVLFAKQGDETEVVLVGLGEMPEVQLVVNLDKLNYATNSNATISINGPPSSTVSLIILDPSDKEKFTDTVFLGPEGKTTYELPLSGYSSGVYDVVIVRGNAQTSDVFSVGLQTGSGPVQVRTTKQSYVLGEGILVLGNSDRNVLIDIEMTDPDGKVFKKKQTFTNRDGVFSEDSFRIPLDAKLGTWTIKANSGQNFGKATINVVGDVREGLVVTVDNVETTPSGKVVTIVGYGARVSQNIVITILAADGEEINKLTIFSTGDGDFRTLWVVPNDLEEGTYTIKAKDAVSEAETPFVLD